jgi:hypothetical protein
MSDCPWHMDGTWMAFTRIARMHDLFTSIAFAREHRVCSRVADVGGIIDVPAFNADCLSFRAPRCGVAGECSLYPRKRTCAVPQAMSAMGLKRTFRHIHSMSASARCCMPVGTSRPSAFAVLRLMTRSNLVDACTGRSAGLAPLRIRSIYAAAGGNCSAKSLA